MSAALEIQKTIYDQLIADQELVSLLNGPDIFDGEPDRRELPYVLFGAIESDDWSTATEDGEEHLVELVVWSSADGRMEAALIAEAIRKALANVDVSSGQNKLVNFSWETTTTQRAKDQRHFIGTLTFRAVTEPVVA